MNKAWVVLLGFLVLGATVVELTGIRARLLGRKRFRFVYASGPMGAEEKSAVTNPPWRLETKEPIPSTSIQVAIAEALKPEAPWLVYFPGNDKAQLLTGVRVLDAARGEHDASLLTFSYRGFSGSTGKAHVRQIQSDSLSLTRALLEGHGISAEHLHLIGFSIGSYFASYVASELTKSGSPPASVTLFSPGYDLVMIRPSFFERLDPGDDYQMAPLLTSIQSRSLVLQGGADEAFAGPDQGKTTAAILANKNGQYREFAGIGHEAILDCSEALTAAREFIWR